MDHLGKSWLWFREWLGIRELGLMHCWALTRPLFWDDTVSVLPSDVFLLILISFSGSSSSVSLLEIPGNLRSTPSRLKVMSRGYTCSRLSRNILYQPEHPCPWFCFIHFLSNKALDIDSGTQMMTGWWQELGWF